MKLSAYAASQGICYKTAWRWFRSGLIVGTQMPTGTILVDVAKSSSAQVQQSVVAVVYARVSSAENRANLDSQASRVAAYCAAKGWKVGDVVKEVGSGLNDKRPKLLRLISDKDTMLVVVEHKDRLTRFGFAYIEAMLAFRGGRIEVINGAAGQKEQLLAELDARAEAGDAAA